jgi:DNA polymerase-3 subunit delta'
MSYSSILDQDVAVRLLHNILANGRIPNGLLFWGPGGVGKSLAAIETAKAINCTTSPGDACNTCLSCRKITNGNHPDVTTIAPTGRSRIINIDMVESINSMAALRPFESKWRVFIIHDADRMDERHGQNHFLKTLEEPPGNSLFILITEYPGRLLPTIRSRCQRVRFNPLRGDTVAGLLRGCRDLDPMTALSIAAVSQGQMDRALDLVDTNKREIALSIAQRLADGEDPVAVAEEFAKHLANRRAQIKTAIESETETGADAGAFSKEDREELKKQHLALAESLFRRDIMEYLYLLETWYRDQEVYSVTKNVEQILNRDQEERLTALPHVAFEPKLTAIDKARVYMERFLNEERVLRDLFFVLAE